MKVFLSTPENHAVLRRVPVFCSAMVQQSHTRRPVAHTGETRSIAAVVSDRLQAGVVSGRRFDVASQFVARLSLRLRLPARILVLQCLLGTALRVVLLVVFGAAAPLGGAWALSAGAVQDALVALATSVPLLLILSAWRLRWLSRRWLQDLLTVAAAFALSFDLFVQYFFFEEYGARYNHLALDYLAYPDEVLGNIFASYDVPLFVGLALGLALALTAATRRIRPALFAEWGWRDRVASLALTGMLAYGLTVAWTWMPAAFLATRVENEIALNGWAQLIRAFRTAHLDYDAYYAMVPAAEADARVARLIGTSGTNRSLIRHFPPRTMRTGPPLDIVVIVEESLGSSFSARFGNSEDPVTPELDRWSHEGLALTGVVANGNRTVRGLEGILCSFVPLPGDAIVKRDRSENVASLARVLRRRGYDTTFYYGGYGLFDNVKGFTTANGYQRFVEQPDYPRDAFRTIWGVADEFVFDRMIADQKAADRTGRPWFATALTVSNHKPFAVPAGRVQSPDGRSSRRKAVLYADWAIGHYLARARQEGLLAHTVVLVVGDHGARVYGSEQIPVESYRVPALLLTPDHAWHDTVIDRLASQVDLAPTVLSLAGVSYDAPFFGRDLLGLPDEGGRAFVNHNRDVGLLTDRVLVVLGLHRQVTIYTRADRHADEFVSASMAPAFAPVVADSKAAFQSAYAHYMARDYRLPPVSPAPTAGTPRSSR